MIYVQCTMSVGRVQRVYAMYHRVINGVRGVYALSIRHRPYRCCLSGVQAVYRTNLPCTPSLPNVSLVIYGSMYTPNFVQAVNTLYIAYA